MQRETDGALNRGFLQLFALINEKNSDTINAFQELLVEAMDPESQYLMTFGNTGFFFLVEELSQDEADRITTLINSISGIVELDLVIWNIVSESASDFFSGQRTAEDAARIIQSRIARYIAEMS